MAERNDPSAIALLRRVVDVLETARPSQMGTIARNLREEDEYLPRAERHARNVAKQRRRLLAERLSLKANTFWVQAAMCPAHACERDRQRAAWMRRHTAKLAALVMRLRGPNG